MVKIGDVANAKEDIAAIFFLTQNRVIDVAECRSLLNSVRKELGFTAEISEDEFKKNFTKTAEQQAQNQPKQIPADTVKHDGQYNQVPVNVPEGQQQFVNVNEDLKK